MYKIVLLVNTIIRGELMKKAIGMMALGMGMGAGAMLMYDQYKNGTISKVVNKGAKELNKVLPKASNK